MKSAVVMAVDAARKTGIAVPSTKPGVPFLKTITFEEGPRPFIFQEFRAALVADIERHGVTDIAIEGPLTLAVIRNAKKMFTTEWTFRMLRGLIGVAEEVAGTYCGGRLHEFTAQQIKKYLTGNRFATKPEMVARARLLGWNPSDDNSADAGALWSLCMAEIDPKFSPAACTPLFASAR